MKQPAAAEFLVAALEDTPLEGTLDRDRRARSGERDPARDVYGAVLNSKWLLSFECGKDEALSLFPYVSRAAAKSESEQRQAFVREMAKLPTQHAVLVKKGLPAIRFRTRDLDNPTKRYPRELLVETFEREIARRSIVRVRHAEKLIATWEADLFASYGGSSAAPRAVKGPESGGAATRGISDLFALLDRARSKSEPEEEDHG